MGRGARCLRGLPGNEMSDKELLERAAKVAGIPIYEWRERETDNTLHGARADSEEATVYWSPLTDDGDALRLAVVMEMRITIWPAGAEVNGGTAGAVFVRSDDVGGLLAATRRAIVRAAANQTPNNETPACPRSPARVQAEAARKWLATPEGMEAIKEAGLAADATILELDAARVIPWQALQEPFTK